MKKLLFTSVSLLIAFTSFSQNNTTIEKARAVFGELKGEGPYTRSDVILQDHISVSSSDGNKYEVVSFRLIIAPKAGTAILLSSRNSSFSENIKQNLYTVVVGDKIIVEAIEATVNGDLKNRVSLEPIMLTIGDMRILDYSPYEAATYGKNNSKNNAPKAGEMPHATFGSIDASDAKTSYTLEDIIAQTEILTKNGGLTYKVTQFKMILAYKELPPVMMSTSGNQLSYQMKEAIIKLKTGDRIIIEGITATAEDNGETNKANLSPIIITIP